ncbi:hypothetical protein VPH35_034947 [Triticum aestivum]
MAAVRCAAGRLGGSLFQRAQTAVTSPAIAKERRRLPSRDVMREIQQKKEELYDVISKADRKVMASDWRNIWLLRHLAVQVNPRPHDSRWGRLSRARRIDNVVETVGVISLTWMLATYWVDKKQVPTVNEENQ